jgi:hypothetical protein
MSEPASFSDTLPDSESQRLTGAQVKHVYSILVLYDRGSLTADQASMIAWAFKSAGIHTGPALDEAITRAGFDPQVLWQLAAQDLPDPQVDHTGCNSFDMAVLQPLHYLLNPADFPDRIFEEENYLLRRVIQSGLIGLDV